MQKEKQKTKNMNAKQVNKRNLRCEGTNVASKCQIFEAVIFPLHGHYAHMCTVSKATEINTENKIFLPNKE